MPGLPNSQIMGELKKTNSIKTNVEVSELSLNISRGAENISKHVHEILVLLITSCFCGAGGGRCCRWNYNDNHCANHALISISIKWLESNLRAFRKVM